MKKFVSFVIVFFCSGLVCANEACIFEPAVNVNSLSIFDRIAKVKYLSGREVLFVGHLDSQGRPERELNEILNSSLDLEGDLEDFFKLHSEFLMFQTELEIYLEDVLPGDFSFLALEVPRGTVDSEKNRRRRSLQDIRDSVKQRGVDVDPFAFELDSFVVGIPYLSMERQPDLFETLDVIGVDNHRAGENLKLEVQLEQAFVDSFNAISEVRLEGESDSLLEGLRSWIMSLRRDWHEQLDLNTLMKEKIYSNYPGKLFPFIETTLKNLIELNEFDRVKDYAIAEALQSRTDSGIFIVSNDHVQSLAFPFAQVCELKE